MIKPVISNSSSTNIRRMIAGLLIAVVAISILLVLESHYRNLGWHGQYFQGWSSEAMMQTLSIEDLSQEPLRSLWYLHIQPPAYEVIRALLAYYNNSENPTNMLSQVDSQIYVIWALLYGMTGFVLYWWLAELTSSIFAVISTLLFLAHPATIFYATMLDTTFITTFLILLFCYLLWRVSEGRHVPVALLVLSFLLLYFTRSIFQWPWLLVLSLSLVLMKFNKYKLLVFLGITGCVIGMYTIKQIYLFDISSTSSFTGLNLSRSIALGGAMEQYDKNHIPKSTNNSEKPHVLTRVSKVDGAINYNNEHFLTVNRYLSEAYRTQIQRFSTRYLAATYLNNLTIYMLPSSRYTQHVIVDRLPYRSMYDSIFSYPTLPAMVLIAAMYWFYNTSKSSLSSALGLIIPIVFIAMVSIIFEKGENMRLKYFIEPVVFIFLASQIYFAGKQAINMIMRNGARTN